MTMTTTPDHLEPLLTLHVTQAEEEFVEAIVLQIPIKLTNVALSSIRAYSSSAGDTDSASFSHLRRVVSGEHLPEEFKQRHKISDNGIDPSTVFVMLPGATAYHLKDVIVDKLRSHMKRDGGEPIPRVLSTIVPVHPPSTAERAKEWSERHWPCVFNAASQTRQEGPPLHTLRSTLVELDSTLVPSYLRMALDAGDACAKMGVGRKVGAVIVDPGQKKVVAVAGDARWWSPDNQLEMNDTKAQSNGRPEHHSLMRAIAMVAQKEWNRRSGHLASQDGTLSTAIAADLRGIALTPIELQSLQNSEISRVGSIVTDQKKPQAVARTESYLCNGLDVYLTHEPCVCCAMAMVHSRFRACVFETRMPGTGGLSGDIENGGLGYGLFWRKELNWRVMAFQYCRAEGEAISMKEEDLFHA